MEPAPPIEIDVQGDEIIVWITTAMGRHGGTLTLERAEQLADQLGGAAEYVRSMKGK